MCEGMKTVRKDLQGQMFLNALRLNSPPTSFPNSALCRQWNHQKILKTARFPAGFRPGFSWLREGVSTRTCWRWKNGNRRRTAPQVRLSVPTHTDTVTSALCAVHCAGFKPFRPSFPRFFFAVFCLVLFLSAPPRPAEAPGVAALFFRGWT